MGFAVVWEVQEPGLSHASASTAGRSPAALFSPWSLWVEAYIVYFRRASVVYNHRRLLKTVEAQVVEPQSAQLITITTTTPTTTTTLLLLQL